MWDRNNLQPDEGFPPSAIYAWNYDNPSDSQAAVVGNTPLVNAVNTTTEVSALSPPLCCEFALDAIYPTSKVSIPNLRDNEVQGFSGWFKIASGFNNKPSDENFVYLCEVAIDGAGFPLFSGDLDQGYGDLLFGFQKVLSGPSGYKAFPTVWVRPGGVPPYRKVELPNPEGHLLGMDGASWIPWNVGYSYGNLVFTIGNKSLRNIPVIWKPKYWNFGGSEDPLPDNSYLISKGVYIDSIALHDVSNNFPTESETCGRYHYLKDDIFLIWDFNKTGISDKTGQSLAFESCPVGLNPDTWYGDGAPSDADGKLRTLEPILPDQKRSCFLVGQKWTPDIEIGADCKGLSFNYVYNDGLSQANPGVLLGCWVELSRRFYLYIETESVGPSQSKIVATLYDSTSDEVADSWVSVDYSEETVNPSVIHYAKIYTDDDDRWDVYTCDVEFEAGVVKTIRSQKALTFYCPEVKYQNRVFVGLNKTDQRYERAVRSITIDKVAFWVNPETPSPYVP